MLYKVTPMMPAPEAKKKAPVEPGAPVQMRKRRKSAVYDADGNEVLVTMMCLKCRAMKPLTMFGLRKMADGAIRNQPWCRTCRSSSSSERKRAQKEEAAHAEVAPAMAVQESTGSPTLGTAAPEPSPSAPSPAVEPESHEHSPVEVEAASVDG